MKIESVAAYQIYDSRGIPTIEVAVRLDNGASGRGLAPSGASTGASEALELRDRDPARFRGLGVDRAIANVNNEIAPALHGFDPTEQHRIDAVLTALDGTPNRSRLGANALVACSMAVAQAGAAARGVPLHAHLGDGNVLPMPQIQIVGGGAHAAGRTDLQDFLIVPLAAGSYDDALKIVFDVHHAAVAMARSQNRYSGVADEGGLFPNFDGNVEILRFVTDAIQRAGYTPGRDVGIALDIAATEFWDAASQRYVLKLDKQTLTSREMIDWVIRQCETFAIVSIEDPLAEDDWAHWPVLNERLGTRAQIIGDDLFTTNAERIDRGIAEQSANAVLIKLNQIGTVSETIAAIRQTQQAGWRAVVSARSGETEDAFIAHLAVGTNAGQIKVGSLTRGERTAKWNELIRIARQLGSTGRFAGDWRAAASSNR